MVMKEVDRTSSPEQKEKKRLKLSSLRMGIKNPNWQGGKSFEEYPADWTETLRRAIRERDGYTCRVCHKKQERTLDVHHVDSNKKNCDPNNLVALCNSCHFKTRSNRDYWYKYFVGGLN